MPTNTTNFSLIKSGQEEFYNVDVPNRNMDIIDGELKALQEAINSGASEQELAELQLAFAEHLTAKATVNEVGHVQLSNLINGSSESKAATEKAIKDAITNVKSWGQNAINAGNTEVDPNTTQDSYILTNHANSPGQNLYWHIQTFFYANRTTNKGQIAITYNGPKSQILTRHLYGEVWTPWRALIYGDMVNVPWGVAGLDGNGFLIQNPKESTVVAGDEFNYTLPRTSGSTMEGVMTPVITFRMFITGTIRVSYNLYNQGAAAHYSRGSELQLYVNDVPIGPLRTVASMQQLNFTEDIPIKHGDTLKFMARALANPGYNTQTLIQAITIKRRGDITL